MSSRDRPAKAAPPSITAAELEAAAAELAEARRLQEQALKAVEDSKAACVLGASLCVWWWFGGGK